MSTTAFLFTGIICKPFFHVFIASTEDIENKFASIWDNEDPAYIEALKEHNFTVILNDTKDQLIYVPQFVPIVNGINTIKQMGYKYILKSRVDISSFDYMKYVDEVSTLDNNKITVIAGIETESDGIYFLDIIVFGRTDEMCKLYGLQVINDKRFFEKFLIENYSGKQGLNKEDLKCYFNFSLDICKKHNIEFIWFRSLIFKTDDTTIPYMRVINEYCKHFIKNSIFI